MKRNRSSEIADPEYILELMHRRCPTCGSHEVGKDVYRTKDEKVPEHIGYSCNRCKRTRVAEVTGISARAVVEAGILALERFYTL